jgi:hypothetical protein
MLGLGKDNFFGLMANIILENGKMARKMVVDTGNH